MTLRQPAQALPEGSSLRHAIDPRSVAIIGASDNPDKIGGRCLEYLSRFGFTGAVFPVNPNRELTQGIKTYPSLDALPEVAQLVIIAVPGQQAVDAVEACAKHGASVAVILAAGFGETGPEGRAQEQRMVAAARRTGLRLIGPNAQGLANFGNGAMSTHATIFLDPPAQDGPVAIISQSGGGASVAYGLLRERGIGVRYCNGIGSQCDVTVAEFALEVARDPHIKLLMLYLEGIPDASQLARLGAFARSRNLPVLVLKAGRTPAGQLTSLSHTGALATEDRVVDAFFEFHGLTRVSDFGDMVNAAQLYLKGWKPPGRRLVVISNSGTACVLAADAASDAGLHIRELLPETRAELSKVLPSFASTANPVDITLALLSNSRMFGDILPIIAREPGTDVFLISIPVAGRGYDVESFARDTAAFAAQTGKPVVVVAPQPKVAARFRDAGLPVFALEIGAVKALAQFISCHELLAVGREAPTDDNTPPSAAPAEQTTGRVLNEADSLALARAFGVPVVDHCLCHSEAEVVRAFAAAGGPVAIKGCSSAVTHKSDLDLVRLNIASEAAARQAWRDIQAAARQYATPLEGVIVASMAPGRRELIVGAHREPTFGAVLTVGDGGKYVEQLPDVQIVMAAATREEIRRAIERLRIAAVFKGVRGEAAMDVEALCDTVLAVGRLMMDDQQAIDSIDLNPVILKDKGLGCVAVDAVIVRRSPDASQPSLFAAAASG